MKRREAPANEPLKTEVPSNLRPASAAFKIPSILLEGDDPEETAPADHPSETAAPGQLPESYGTGQLLLVARDPHCVYAHWDISTAAQAQYQQRAARNEIVLRLHQNDISGPIESEAPLPAGSQSQFITVGAAGAKYAAETGYFAPGGDWVCLAASQSVATPQDKVSSERNFEIATLGPEASAKVESQSVAAAAESGAARKQLIPPRVGWIPALGIEPTTDVGQENATPEQISEMQPASEAEGQSFENWTEAQEAALATLLTVSRPAASSLEVAGISSALGPPAAQPEFWLRIDADVIVHGATDPTARVMLEGRQIEVQPDGTFSCRISLPDGEHSVIITAVSQHDETRKALLRFQRRTEWNG
jgi:uncharacterized protein